MTREEELWAAIIAALNGDDVDVPVPAWRREEFLVGILGAIKGVEGASVPEPVWREEQYLKAMFDELSSGGGGSSYTLLGSKEFEVSTTSTTATSVGTFTVEGSYTKDYIVYVKVRDKAGKRNGYFLGGDFWFVNIYAANGGTTALSTYGKISIGVNSSGAYSLSASSYGVYPDSIAGNGTISISSKYHGSYGTIDGTYVVEVYALKWPNDDSPFKEATA